MASAQLAPLPTLGFLCLWLHNPDRHLCPASPYWQQRRAKMTTLETAPAEVLHAICALLCPKDVAAARLTSNVLAQIGAHYLVRQATFYTSEASLDRLQKIADHQVFRQYVESLHFEANLLANLCCRSCWLERFAVPGHGTRAHKLEKPEALQPPNTVREKRAYARNLLKWEEDVNEAYDNHHALREAQQELHQQGPELMAKIMPQLPRLQKITFTIGRCQHALSKRFQEEFDRKLGFCPPLSTDTSSTGSQLKHIILPGGNPLRDLQSLVVSDLDPSLFNPKGGPGVMRHAFANLKKLDISFRLPDKVEPSTEPGLYSDLKDGGLRDAISSADNLEDLRIAFNDFTYDGACVELNNILGERSFDHLKKLSISYVEAEAKSFIETLKRQKVLKHVAIHSVYIKGSWVKVLDKMQKELSLKQATFEGFLTDSDGMYDVSPSSYKLVISPLSGRLWWTLIAETLPIPKLVLSFQVLIS
jgi:hypothetical protein